MGNSWTECTICRNEPQHCKCENPLTDPEFDKLIREGTSFGPIEGDGFPEERMEEAKAEYEQFGSSFSIWHAGRWGYAEGLKAGRNPGDIVLSADEAAKVLAAIGYVDYLPNSVTIEAIQILDQAMRK